MNSLNDVSASWNITFYYIFKLSIYRANQVVIFLFFGYTEHSKHKEKEREQVCTSRAMHAHVHGES